MVSISKPYQKVVVCVNVMNKVTGDVAEKIVKLFCFE